MEYDILTIIDISARCVLAIGIVSGMVFFITLNVRFKGGDEE
jgi:hypothetical protein